MPKNSQNDSLRDEIDSLSMRLENSRELAKKDWCPMCGTNKMHYIEQLMVDIASAELRLKWLEEKIES